MAGLAYSRRSGRCISPGDEDWMHLVIRSPVPGVRTRVPRLRQAPVGGTQERPALRALPHPETMKVHFKKRRIVK